MQPSGSKSPAMFYSDIQRAFAAGAPIAVHLALYKADGTVYDKAIRFITGGDHSHVELALSCDSWGPTPWCLSSSPRDGGVRAKQMPLPLDRWDLLTLPWASPRRIVDMFINIDGQPYDWAGIFLTQFFKFNLINHASFCSEACAYMLDLPKPTHYSPDHLGALLAIYAPVVMPLETP